MHLKLTMSFTVVWTARYRIGGHMTAYVLQQQEIWLLKLISAGQLSTALIATGQLSTDQIWRLAICHIYKKPLFCHFFVSIESGKKGVQKKGAYWFFLAKWKKVTYWYRLLEIAICLSCIMVPSV